MTRNLPSYLVAALVAFCIVSVASGRMRVVGQNAVDSFRCFNMYLDFNRATVEEDYLLMASLAAQIEDISGDSGVREFSAYIAGYSTSADSHNRPDQDALHWAETAVKWLDSSVALRNKPWNGLQLATMIYADRILPNSTSRLAREQMLNTYAAWMASGGGPNGANPLSAKVYQDYLACPPHQRDNYILSHLTQIMATE